MKSCQEVSRLLSESMERKLSLGDRLGLWLHLAMCRLCRGFSKDLQLLRDAARQHAREVEAGEAISDAALSAEARRRIRRVLESEAS